MNTATIKLPASISSAKETVAGNADVIGTAVNAVVAVAFAICSGLMSGLVANDLDMQLVAVAYSAPDWVAGLGWVGIASVILALCYLGLELGYSVLGCLSRRGHVKHAERPAFITALQWLSAMALCASILIHFSVLISCAAMAQQYPVAISSLDEIRVDHVGGISLVFLVCLLVSCPFVGLGPDGRFFFIRRFANEVLRPHRVARWLYMCLSMLIAPLVGLAVFVLACCAWLLLKWVIAVIVLVIVLISVLAPPRFVVFRAGNSFFGW